MTPKLLIYGRVSYRHVYLCTCIGMYTKWSLVKYIGDLYEQKNGRRFCKIISITMNLWVKMKLLMCCICCICYINSYSLLIIHDTAEAEVHGLQVKQGGLWFERILLGCWSSVPIGHFQTKFDYLQLSFCKYEIFLRKSIIN